MLIEEYRALHHEDVFPKLFWRGKTRTGVVASVIGLSWAKCMVSHRIPLASGWMRSILQPGSQSVGFQETADVGTESARNVCEGGRGKLLVLALINLFGYADFRHSSTPGGDRDDDDPGAAVLCEYYISHAPHRKLSFLCHHSRNAVRALIYISIGKLLRSRKALIQAVTMRSSTGRGSGTSLPSHDGGRSEAMRR